MKIEVLKKETVELEEYWVIRGIRDTGTMKEVVAEFEMSIEPNALAIAKFLSDNPKANFCSIAHNYRIK